MRLYSFVWDLVWWLWIIDQDLFRRKWWLSLLGYKEHLWGYIIRYWRRSLHLHGNYSFQNLFSIMISTQIIIPKISLDTLDFYSVGMPAQDVVYPQRCFRYSILTQKRTQKNHNDLGYIPNSVQNSYRLTSAVLLAPVAPFLLESKYVC